MKTALQAQMYSGQKPIRGRGHRGILTFYLVRSFSRASRALPASGSRRSQEEARFSGEKQVRRAGPAVHATLGIDPNRRESDVVRISATRLFGAADRKELLSCPSERRADRSGAQQSQCSRVVSTGRV